LFIDSSYEFLGASPDGVVEGEDSIIEIKCPFKCAGMDEAELVFQKLLPWKNSSRNDNAIRIFNKNHDYYYQVQGQLQIANKARCYLAFWTCKDKSLKVETIQRDEDFWEHSMLPKLIQFYNKHYVAELVDSREQRGMPMRYADESKIKKKKSVAIK
jgi:YqaJ-like viral recombinase domain